MGRDSLVPSALTKGPFTLSDARRHGLDHEHLQTRTWRRIARATYVLASIVDDPIHQLEAARRRLPAGSAFSGFTAAWLHGLDVAPCNPIEATVPTNAGVSGRSGMALHRAALASNEVVQLRGFAATRIERTLVEVTKRLVLTEGVVLVDAALHHRIARMNALHAWTDEHSGFHGIPSLRRALAVAEPAAESPMESRLRMVLILGGLPRPRAQIPIHDRWGRFIGRPDLYYEEARLGIEYDGGTHRESLAADNRRQNRLLDAGIRLLRYTAADVLGNADLVVQQVRAMLRS